MNALPHILGMDEWMKQAAEFREKTRPCNTWLYFIESGEGGPIKIGIARDPWERIETLQIGNPEPLRLLTLCYSSQDEERQIHRVLKDDRIHGEWFVPSERLYAAIEAIQQWSSEEAIDTFPDRFHPRIVRELEKVVAEILAGWPEDEDGN